MQNENCQVIAVNLKYVLFYKPFFLLNKMSIAIETTGSTATLFVNVNKYDANVIMNYSPMYI